MKNKFKITTLTLGIFSAIFLAYLVVSAWTEPTQSPPGGNVSIDLDCINLSEKTDVTGSGFQSFYSPSCPSGYTWVRGGYGIGVTRRINGVWRDPDSNNRTVCRALKNDVSWIRCEAYCCRIN